MRWNEGGGQFEKTPSGNFIARCYAVIDMGTQLQKGFQGGPDTHARKVRISFELPTEKMEGIYDEKAKGKPFSVHLNAKQSLHPKANLRKMLEGWRGKKFTAESIATFDPRKLVGLPCRVTLVENGDYTNIESISPLAKSDKCPKQVNPSIYFSLDEFDAETFEKLGKKTQEKIALSPEYKMVAGNSESGEEPQEEPVDEPQQDDSDPF